MKKRITIIAMLLVPALLGIVFLFDPGKLRRRGASIPNTGPAGPQAPAGRPAGSLLRDANALYNQAKSELIPGSEWHVPIRFYGRVVDEKGDPLPYVDVELGVQDFSLLALSGHKEYRVQSDSKGFFQFKGAKGKSLAVRLSKVGFYPFSGPGNTFEFGDPYNPDLRFYTPDPAKPVVFRLQTKGRAEVLVHWQTKPAISQQGAPLRLDIQTGETNAAGELQLELLRNVSSRSGVTRGAWAMRASAPSGGVLWHTNEYPFLAPAEGYQLSIDLDEHTPKPVNSLVWSYDGGAFFMKSGRNYARVEVRMSRGSETCEVECFLNPRGSRNLELDPTIQQETKMFYRATGQ